MKDLRIRTRRRPLILTYVPESGSAELPGPWHEIGDVGEPAFQNSWDNFLPGILPPLSYRKVGEFVELVGLIVGGAEFTTITTLPVGFRPSTSTGPIGLAVRTDGVNNFFAAITLNSDGTLVAGIDHTPSSYPILGIPYTTIPLDPVPV